MTKKTSSNKSTYKPSEDNKPFYGPFSCDVCDRMIVRASSESGGAMYDQPLGGAYPNTIWQKHECLTETEQISKLRLQVKKLEREVADKDHQIIILETHTDHYPRDKWNPYPQLPAYPIWMDTKPTPYADNRMLCLNSGGMTDPDSGNRIWPTASADVIDA